MVSGAELRRGEQADRNPEPTLRVPRVATLSTSQVEVSLREHGFIVLPAGTRGILRLDVAHGNVTRPVEISPFFVTEDLEVGLGGRGIASEKLGLPAGSWDASFPLDSLERREAMKQMMAATTMREVQPLFDEVGRINANLAAGFLQGKEPLLAANGVNPADVTMVAVRTGLDRRPRIQ